MVSSQRLMQCNMAVSSTQVSSNPGVSTRTNLLPLSEVLREESMTFGESWVVLELRS